MNIICSVFGHRKTIRDWYPHDPITTLYCHRCNKILDQRSNPMYHEGAVVNYHNPWINFAEHQYEVVKNQIISPIDPYGEEQWEDQ